MFYYVPPQLWAWAGWRVKKVKRTSTWSFAACHSSPTGTEHAASVRPSTSAILTLTTRRAASSIESFLAQVQAKANAHPGPLVAILPGSRTQELTRNLPIMLRAAAKLARQRPATRFAVACLHERHRALAEQIIRANARGGGHPRPDRRVRRTDPRADPQRRLAWAVSGSVSLELMMEALPTVILYKLNRSTS